VETLRGVHCVSYDKCTLYTKENKLQCQSGGKQLNAAILSETFLIKASILRFHVLTAASMKFRGFWDVAPCSHIEDD
jgi:hypothetical protein